MRKLTFKYIYLSIAFAGLILFLSSCSGGGGNSTSGPAASLNDQDSLLINNDLPENEIIVSNEKAITEFSFKSIDNPLLFVSIETLISENSITAVFPENTDLSNLIASFSFQGKEVFVNNTMQISSLTVNDFSVPVTYTVVAEDGSSEDYIVNLSNAVPGIAEITSFSIDGQLAAISGSNISLTLKEEIDLSSLIADFTLSNGKAYVNSIEQVSGSTVNDFSSPVLYTVETNDGSQYLYTVNVSKDPAANIIIPEIGIISSNTSVQIEVTDNEAIPGNSILVNGEEMQLPALYNIYVDNYLPGENSFQVEVTDSFGQISVVNKSFTIERDSILPDNVSVDSPLEIANPAALSEEWSSPAGSSMEFSLDSEGNTVLSSNSSEYLIYNRESPLSNLIFEADFKLIKGAGYSLMVRANHSGSNMPTGYAFQFNPEINGPNNGFKLVHYPSESNLAPVQAYQNIDMDNNWHRVRLIVFTNQANQKTYLEAYIGSFADPENGSGELIYQSVYSVRIDALDYKESQAKGRILTTNLIDQSPYNSGWDSQIDSLYDSGSVGLRLWGDDNQTHVRNIKIISIQ